MKYKCINLYFCIYFSYPVTWRTVKVKTASYSNCNYLFQKILFQVFIIIFDYLMKNQNDAKYYYKHLSETCSIKVLFYCYKNIIYSESCLNQATLRPACFFRIDRSLVYTGLSSKGFSQWDSCLFRVWISLYNPYNC